MSEDGTRGITVIAFIGSVFSPYYYWQERAEPENHVAVNVCLYGKGAGRWSMSERRADALSRTAAGIAIGPSALSWENDGLRVRIEERAVPHLTRLRGRIRIMPEIVNLQPFSLDAAGAHRWHPIGPRARIEVDFERPSWRWQGSGYLDMNWGASGIEDAFARWDWSRTADAAEPVMLYDVARRDGTPGSLALRFRRDGTADAFDPPERHPLFNGLWRMPRWTQSEAAPRMLARLEDAPFYARSEIETTLFGERVRAMHETFDGDRFRQRWVKALLPWRMPRVPSGALSPVGKFF